MSAASKRGSMSTTRLRKVMCPDCGCIARMSRTAITRSGLPTCGCGAPMVCEDINDLAAVCPTHPLLTEAAHDHAAFVKRSVEQRNRHRSGSWLERVDAAEQRASDVVRDRFAAALQPVARQTDDIPF